MSWVCGMFSSSLSVPKFLFSKILVAKPCKIDIVKPWKTPYLLNYVTWKVAKHQRFCETNICQIFLNLYQWNHAKLTLLISYCKPYVHMFPQEISLLLRSIALQPSCPSPHSACHPIRPSIQPCPPHNSALHPALPCLATSLACPPALPSSLSSPRCTATLVLLLLRGCPHPPVQAVCVWTCDRK